MGKKREYQSPTLVEEKVELNKSILDVRASATVEGSVKEDKETQIVEVRPFDDAPW